jgi:prephenate dehydrogenase
MHWNKVTLVGVGLLGGSLGLALKRRRLAREVAGYVRRPASVKECAEAGAVDFATTDLLAAVWNADLVILCTPLGQMRSLLAQMLPALKRGAIVTDVGSVKGNVVAELEELASVASGRFIGSHPMAGAEKTGVASARADLFVNAACVVTPTARSNRMALRKVEQLWKAVGGRVLRMTAEMHDALVARSSHLPHLLAATLASHILHPKQSKHLAALCANGFRDSTRIASGSPEMWRDIALANRKQLRVALDEFVRELQGVQAILRRRDAGAISQLFEAAKRRRDDWCSQCASPSPE